MTHKPIMINYYSNNWSALYEGWSFNHDCHSTYVYHISLACSCVLTQSISTVQVYCTKAHGQWLSKHVIHYCKWVLPKTTLDINKSCFCSSNGDPGYLTRAVLRLVWPLKVQRRSSILQQPAHNRIATAAKPVAASRVWCAVPVKRSKTKLISTAHIIVSLGHHPNLTHYWHHGTRHTCKVS